MAMSLKGQKERDLEVRTWGELSNVGLITLISFRKLAVNGMHYDYSWKGPGDDYENYL